MHLNIISIPSQIKFHISRLFRFIVYFYLNLQVRLKGKQSEFILSGKLYKKVNDLKSLNKHFKIYKTYQIFADYKSENLKSVIKETNQFIIITNFLVNLL